MIYITGSTGFIGKSVIKELQKKKISFKRIKIRFKTSIAKLNSIYKKSLKKNDILIHLGWGQMSDPWSAFHKENNYQNSLALFKFAKKNFYKKVIFCGSMNEYGNKYGPLKENTKPGKLETLYAKSKLNLTNFGLNFFKNSSTSFYSIRPSYVFGMYQRKGTLVNLLIQAFKKKKILKMTKCMNFRDYIHVDEVAKGIVKVALVKKKIETGIYNLGSGKCITIRNFIIMFCKLIKFNQNFLKFGAIQEKKEQKQLKSYLVCKKIKKNLNWSPNPNIKIGLRKIAKNIL